MTIIAPTYLDTGATHTAYHRGQWKLMDVTAAHQFITHGAALIMARDSRPGRVNADSRLLWDNWRWNLLGKIGEAAFAMHYGMHLEQLVTDTGGADFVRANRYIDVKTTTGQTFVNVQLPRLDRMAETGLHKWVIVAAKAAGLDGIVTLVGQRPATHLTADYDIRPPEPGHQYPYIAIPLDDFYPLDDPTGAPA